MNEYFKQLDGLRFIAVFMVMFAHYVQYQMGNVIITSIPMVYGVLLFFVLSGFLITRILLAQRERPLMHTLKSFYIRRVLRIFPVFYLVIFTLFVFDYQNTRELFVWLSTYTINIYESLNNTTNVGDFNHIWSLAVEEQFYLIWPIVVLVINKRYFLRVTLTAILGSLFFKIYLAAFTPFWVWNDLGLSTNFYGLGLGAILAYLSLERHKLFIQMISNRVLFLTSLMAIGTVAVELLFDFRVLKEALMPFVWAIFFMVVIGRSTRGFTGMLGWFLTHRVVVFLGKISYGMYIIHQFVPAFFFRFNPESIFIQNKYIGFLGFSLITIVLASLSWYGMEKPINKLKKAFKY